MAKLLKPKDRLRLLLAGLGDLFEDVADAGGLMSFSYQQVYGYYPRKYKKSNFYLLVNRGLKTKEIEKVKINGVPHLKLTTKGKTKTIRNFPFLSLQKKKWDSLFTQASYDIQETNKKTRELWREKLKELNFGQLQRSVYISPFNLLDDLWEFVQEKRLQSNVFISRVRFIGINPKDTAYKVWSLKGLEKAYEKLLEEWKEKKLTSQEFLSSYFDILFTDPHLPQELLPKTWPGFTLQKIAKQVQKKT
ncbi:hypothetical protein ISS85_01320 [Candidatus Microgenomates bacterium]|nr:hypothetical protein [Candidatus Microgenomates bacterium]